VIERFHPLKEGELRFCGFFHSHPSLDVFPSRKDIEVWASISFVNLLEERDEPVYMIIPMPTRNEVLRGSGQSSSRFIPVF